MTLANVDHQEAALTRAGLEHTKQQLQLLEDFVRDVLREGQDYGTIPGTDKPSLWKPGAANVIAAFNCHSEPTLIYGEVSREGNFVRYEHFVDVVSNNTSKVMARGSGACNSYEVKYRYRELKRTCPICYATSIIKGKEEFGGGWLCWRKQGGCGQKYPDGSTEIEGQQAGRIENEDVLDQANTILKMSIKRAEVDAAMRLPGVARFFTQDLEDMRPSDEATSATPAPAAKKEARIAAPAPAPGEAQRQAAGKSPPAATCEFHGIRMGVKDGQRCHRLDDGTFCPGRKVETVSEPAPDVEILEVGEEISAGMTLEDLQDYLDSEEVDWADFQTDILKMPWHEWVELGGTPDTALARYQKSGE